jgi:6-phosphogluconolactonase
MKKSLIFRLQICSLVLLLVGCGSGKGGGSSDPSPIGFAYVTNDNAASSPYSILQYTIGSDGTLTSMATPTVAAGMGPVSVTVDPSGKYAYVANWISGDVSQYTIGANGALTSMATPTIAAGTGPWSVTVDPSDKYVYVAN